MTGIIDLAIGPDKAAVFFGLNIAGAALAGPAGNIILGIAYTYDFAHAFNIGRICSGRPGLPLPGRPGAP